MFTCGAIADDCDDDDDDDVLVLGLLTGVVVAVGFVVADDDDDDDNTAEVGGVADNVGDGFTVFGIPHICDSVVLTILRLRLLGSHIFALRSADIVMVLGELLLPLLPADDGDDNGNCCAYTLPAEKIIANRIIIVIVNSLGNREHLCFIGTCFAVITYKHKINYYRRKN